MSTNALIVSIIGIALILFVLIFWFISQYSSRRYNSYIKSSVNSVRSVIVDWNKQEVRFFNRTHLRYVRTIPLERYYWQFSKRDAKKLNDWFTELLKVRSRVSDSCEVEVRLHRARRYFPSLLQVVNVDYDKKIINFDSYLFAKTGRYKNKFDQENSKIRFSTGSKGYTASFSFTGISQAGNKEKVSPLLFAQLKEIVAETITPMAKELIHTGDDNFIVVDFKITDQNKAMNDIHRINNRLRKFLEINNKLNRVNITIGLVYNSYYRNNIRKLIEKATAMSKIANEKGTLIVTFSKNMKNNAEEDKFDSEIEQVIKKKQITYNFLSVYNAKRERTIGYIVKPTPINSSAETMSELYARSLKTGENHQLLQVIFKDSVNAFTSQENHDTILFRRLRFNETETFFSARPTSKSIRQAVIFDEYDISYSSNEDKEFMNKIKKYREKGIDICLALSDKSLVLDHKIYALFDFFFVYANEAAHHRDEASNIALRTIIEKVLKYDKPIILTNVDSWSSIELFIRSGVEYIASSAITPLSNKLLEPASKTKAKIRRMLN